MEDADATRAVVHSTSLLPGDPITVWFSDEEGRRVDRYNGSVLKSDDTDITVAWCGGASDGQIYRVSLRDDDWVPGWYGKGLGYEDAKGATPLTNSMALLMGGQANSAVSHDLPALHHAADRPPRLTPLRARDAGGHVSACLLLAALPDRHRHVGGV